MQREFSVFSRACPSARSTAAESAELAFGDRWGIHPFPLSLFPHLSYECIVYLGGGGGEDALFVRLPSDRRDGLPRGLGRSARDFPAAFRSACR